jgi:Concanavalin A-like lectin/glucanases superfamily/Repeat of unknown function (DUF346)
MSKRALAFGFGGYADLDLTFGEFFAKNHAVTIRYMPQHPYGAAGPLLAENGNGTYAIGVGDYRWGRGTKGTLGNSMLFVQVGSARAVYEVNGFVDDVGGPIGYRNVWQHLTVVRQGQTLRTYLNGKLLPAFQAAALVVPSSGLPSTNTPLRLGRRTSGVSDKSRFWQFYGLIDDVGIFKRALSNDEISKLAAAPGLTGDEDGLLAGYNFDNEFLPDVLSRPVTLPTAADIPDYVNEHASHPVPVHYVEVSSDRDSAADAGKVEIRPSKVQTRPPFAAGEWWRVSQGWEHPAGSHNGTAAYCWDCVRINGPTLGAKIFAAAGGKVIYAKQDASGDESSNASCVYHTVAERAVYMHLKEGFYSTCFPDAPSLPADGNIPEGSQPSFKARDLVAQVGHNPHGDHLHFEVADISGKTFDTAGPGVPAAYSNFYRSNDAGKSWKKVSLGIPVAGDVIASYPWSPWSNIGDPLSVAPAVTSFASNRLDVFARGENDHLWQKSWNGTAWGPWKEVAGGRLTSSPCAVAWAIPPLRIEVDLHVFVRGFENKLAHKRAVLGQIWTEWEDLGGKLASAPAVASWALGRLDVFAKGENGHLMHKRWNGDDWSEWRDLGGRLTSAPAAVSWGPNRIDVFVRGHDLQLAHKRWNGEEWSEWRDLGGNLTSSPAVASWGPNRLDVFARGEDSHLKHKRWNGEDWSEWRDLGGRLTSAPGAVSWGLNRIDVLVRGHDYQLAHKRWNGEEWSEWRDLDVD